MRKVIKFIIRLFIWVCVLVFIVFIALILLNTIKSYQPDDLEILEIIEKGSPENMGQDTISLISWNIGYGGLGKEIDFFYEGGTQVRPSFEGYQNYMDGIQLIMGVFMKSDFILLQEVDTYAKRSYFNNQVELFWNGMENGSMVFAKNFDVRFVPVPPLSPMGNVISGVVSFSKHTPISAERYAFPPDESWPMRLFLLERCYILTRYELENGILTLINTHNSAYDETGEAKQVQLEMIKEKMMEEYALGHWVIAGGDWNQNPPGFDAKNVTTNDIVKTIIPLIPFDLLPAEWTWAYDPAVPTNRNVDIPYQKGNTQTTIIDYFVVSPNIEVLEVKTHSTNFEFTDHQPVKLRVRLK